MKKYIIINYGIIGIGGGQLYTKNKARFMEDKGYEVYVLYCHNYLDISIEYLKKFENGHFPELELNLACLSQRRIDKSIDKMLKHINYNDGDEVTIESNALDLSSWGEVLAERVKGKHIIFSVSEKNRIDESNLKYTEFKYMRSELATINERTFSNLYEKSNIVPNSGVKKLTAFLGDPVEEYDAPEIDNLNLKDKNICIIGRMFKPYVIYSCKKLSDYVIKYPEIQFSLTLLGMKDEEVILQVVNLMADCNNTTVNFVDSLSPIPKKVFSMFDLIIGGAGCASLPYRQGSLTLCMDVHTDKALGLMGYDLTKALDGNPCPKEFEDYMDDALFTKDYKNRKFIAPDYPTKEECFSEHDDFLSKTDATKEYFDFSKCTVSKKEKIKTILYSIFGVKRANSILKFLYGIGKH